MNIISIWQYFGGLVIAGLITFMVANFVEIKYVYPASGWDRVGFGLVVGLIRLSWIVFCLSFSISFWYKQFSAKEIREKRNVELFIKPLLQSLLVQWIGLSAVILWLHWS